MGAGQNQPIPMPKVPVQSSPNMEAVLQAMLAAQNQPKV
jgi:hypothetical protein